VLAILFAARALATPAAPGHPLAARIVWVGAGRVYLASSDSIALDPLFRLTFFKGGKPVASASVERVLDGHLIAARITSGETDAFRKPDRLEVTGSAPALTPPGVMRVGIPARSNELLNCGASLRPPSAYPAASRSGSAQRLVRAAPMDSLAPWPDTLVVVPFASADDEEIAIERGEIDAGVFWPGELSDALRRAPIANGLYFEGKIPRGSASPDTARVRCPVICSATIRPYVIALGADAFGALPGCAPGAP